MKIYNSLIWIFLLSLFISSCFDDKGNYSYEDIENLLPFTVKGVKDTTCYLLEKLNIDPVIQGMEDESKYNFVWYVLMNNTSGAAPPRDTLSTEKSIKDYTITQSGGQYQLVFIIQDKQTGANLITKYQLTITSRLGEGFYVLKDNNGNTDLDIILPDKSVEENVISTITGRQLPGEAVQTLYQTDGYIYEFVDEDGTVTLVSNKKVLHLLSKEEIFTVDGSDFTIYRTFDDMFYDVPSVKRPQSIKYMPYGLAIYVLNADKLHCINLMYGGDGRYGGEKAGDYELYSDVLYSSFSGVLGFDKKTKSYIGLDAGEPSIYNLSNREGNVSPSNLGADIIALIPRQEEFVYASAYSIMENSDKSKNEGYVMELYHSSPTGYPFQLIDTLPLTYGVFNADIYAANKIASYIYFSQGNQLYTHYVLKSFEGMLPEDREKLVYTFPTNEEITYITHMYNESTSEGSFNHLVVLTTTGGNWKLYRFNMIGQSAEFESNPVEIYSGQGTARHVIYKY